MPTSQDSSFPSPKKPGRRCGYPSRCKHAYDFNPNQHRFGNDKFTDKNLNQKNISVSSSYLPPDLNSIHIKDQLNKIVDDMPVPFILFLDSNAHNEAWGSPTATSDARGAIITEFIDERELILLNDGRPTFLTSAGHFTHIDLTIGFPDIASNLKWYTLDDTMDSDHFPIIRETGEPSPINPKPPKWNLRKANWKEYQKATKSK